MKKIDYTLSKALMIRTYLFKDFDNQRSKK